MFGNGSFAGLQSACYEMESGFASSVGAEDGHSGVHAVCRMRKKEEWGKEERTYSIPKERFL